MTTDARPGVRFHLGETGAHFDGRQLELSGGTRLEVDFLVVGSAFARAST